MYVRTQLGRKSYDSIYLSNIILVTYFTLFHHMVKFVLTQFSQLTIFDFS